jgi:MoCo/4Fe-4S cofactor protein with predicted Tat translocation signal
MSEDKMSDKPAGEGLTSAGVLPILSEPPRFWKSLEELAGRAAHAGDHDHHALPATLPLQLDEPSRRDFFRFMAASLALGGATGCAYQPAESIVPYVLPPESVIPGKPAYYTSAVPIDGFACGVIVKSDMGRPIKIEGNPDHPASLGSTDAFIQAAVLTLYDPDRSQLLTHNGRVDTWEHFQTLALDLRAALKEKKGTGLRILTQTVASPTLADQLQRLIGEFPEAKWHSYEPISRDSVRAGCRQAFGEDVEPVYHLEKADIVVALDADFLAWGPGRIKDARAFASRREPGDPAAAAAAAPGTMNRLYSIESTPTLTGAAADHRLHVLCRDVGPFARALAAELGIPNSPAPDTLGAHRSWIAALARDLKAHRGTSLVMAGDSQPADVHALAHLINHTLGNVGKTVDFISRVDSGPADQRESIRDLVRAMSSGEVETLIILGGNPAYDAPADLEFDKRLADKNVKLRIHLGLYDDETAQLCHWHIPEAHSLESWSDLRAFDGTAAIVQPLIAPLYKGRSPHELLALFLGQPDLSPLEIVRDFWRRQKLGPDFEPAWRLALETGVIAGTRSEPKQVSPTVNASASAAAAVPSVDALEIVFRPDPTIGDGRFANNGWLQELPKPLTKLSWDNAALLSPATAHRLGVDTEDLVDLRQGDRTVRLPVMVLPGQADGSITVTLGLGRRRSGRVGTGVGVDVYPLRTTDAPWFASGLEVKKTSEHRRLAAMHQHFSMEGRDLIRVGSIDDYRRDPAFAHRKEEEEAHGRSLIDDPAPQAEDESGHGNAWGMAINLNTCIGCGACIAACQAENNIPIVGREQVLVSREMHWIRVDRYFEGTDTANPKVDFQPVPCMQCEKAPCEIVCPVAATTHSAEGLNEMTYNRCVGTRYCSNNCPYKVRRFNFLHYNDDNAASLKLMRNPDVTVRARGVMEKCTYCVQRINAARINSEMEHRELGGDEVVTACQAACPTRAIVFGNLNDSQSAVSKAKASPRNYALLAELNTRPRTTYLAKLRNPNPEIEAIARDGTQRS